MGKTKIIKKGMIIENMIKFDLTLLLLNLKKILITIKEKIKNITAVLDCKINIIKANKLIKNKTI